MLKHMLALIIFSIVVILFLPQFSYFLHIMAICHAWFIKKLLFIFSSTAMGRLISCVLALILIPLIIALIPAFIYWLIRRAEMPYVASITWVLWIMLATITAMR